MNLFDAEMVKLVANLWGNSPLFDGFMKWAAASGFVKGEVVVPVLWWAWFKTQAPDSKHRARLLATLLASFVAMFVARVMAIALPFRQRPIHNPDLQSLPFHHAGFGAEEWSSFPSDHAVLFVALATGMFFISRRVGLLSLVYVGAFVCFPRTYVGLHYSTDILAGALIGAGIVTLGNRCLVDTPLTDYPIRVAEEKPHIFYPLFFWMTFQIATMFRSLRAVGEILLKYI